MAADRGHCECCGTPTPPEHDGYHCWTCGLGVATEITASDDINPPPLPSTYPSATPLEIVIMLETVDRIDAVMAAALTVRERLVLRLRYGLTDEGPCTFADIGRAIGVKRTRAQIVTQNALRRLSRHGFWHGVACRCEPHCRTSWTAWRGQSFTGRGQAALERSND